MYLLKIRQSISTQMKYININLCNEQLIISSVINNKNYNNFKATITSIISYSDVLDINDKIMQYMLCLVVC